MSLVLIEQPAKQDILTERQAEVVFLRKVEGKTLQAVAEKIGVTRERIRQIEAVAMQKIKDYEIGCL